MKQFLSYSGQDQKHFSLYLIQWDQRQLGVLFNDAFDTLSNEKNYKNLHTFSFLKQKLKSFAFF